MAKKRGKAGGKNSGLIRAGKGGELQIVPAIFIGMGGFGSDVLASLRAKLVRKLDDEGLNPDDYLDKVYQFIAFDSAGYGSENRAVPAANYLNLQLDKADLKVKQYARHKDFKQFWYQRKRGAPYLPGTMGSGAGQIRLHGRLVLFSQIANPPTGTSTIPKIIRNAARTAKNIFHNRTAMSNRYLRVFMFSSICGGTGSGILTDVAAIVRNEFTNPDTGPSVNHDLMSFFLTPDVVMSKVGEKYQDKIYANAYSVMKELNHWMSPVADNQAPYRYKFRKYQINLPDMVKLFDLVHLFDCENNIGQTVKKPERMVSIISEIVFMMAASRHSSGQATDALDNALRHYQQHHSFNFSGTNMPISFGSGGMAYMEFPKESIAEFCTKRATLQILQNHCLSDEKQSQIDTVADALKKGFDVSKPALRKALKKHRLIPFSPTEYEAKINKGSLRDIEEYMKGKGEDSHGQVFAALDEKLDKFYRSASEELVDEIKRAFSTTLSGRLTKLRFPNELALIKLAIDPMHKDIGREIDLEPKVKKGEKASETIAQECVRLQREIEKYENQVIPQMHNRLKRTYSEKWGLVFPAATSRKIHKGKLIAALKRYFELMIQHSVAKVIQQFYEDAEPFLDDLRAVFGTVNKKVIGHLKSDLKAEEDAILEDEETEVEEGVKLFVMSDPDWVRENYGGELSEKQEEQTAVTVLRRFCPEQVIPLFNSGGPGEVDRTMLSSELGTMRSTLEDYFEDVVADSFDRVADMDIWQALEVEARLANGLKKDDMSKKAVEAIREFMSNRVKVLKEKASPWLPSNEAHLGEEEYTDQLDYIILRMNEKAEATLRKRFKFGIDELLGQEVGAYSTVKMKGDEEKEKLSFCVLEYGYPPFSIAGIHSWAESYGRIKHTGIPRHIDRRYEDHGEREWFMKEIFPPELGDRLWFLLGEVFGYSKKLGVNYANFGTGAKGKMTMNVTGPFIKPTKAHGNYVFDDHENPKVSKRCGREYAYEFLTDDDRGRTIAAEIREKITGCWNSSFSATDQKKFLGDLKEWLKDRRDSTRSKALINEFQKDVDAVSEKLKSGDLTLSDW